MRASLLLVDDEQANLSLLHTYIKDIFSDQFSISTASSGNEAVISLSTRNFDLVITDLKMPNGDGHFILNYLSHSKIPTPVIVWTAEDPSVHPLLLQAGAHKVLSKIGGMSELIQEIGQLLDGIKKV